MDIPLLMKGEGKVKEGEGSDTRHYMANSWWCITKLYSSYTITYMESTTSIPIKVAVKCYTEKIYKAHKHIIKDSLIAIFLDKMGKLVALGWLGSYCCVAWTLPTANQWRHTPVSILASSTYLLTPREMTLLSLSWLIDASNKTLPAFRVNSHIKDIHWWPSGVVHDLHYVAVWTYETFLTEEISANNNKWTFTSVCQKQCVHYTRVWLHWPLEKFSDKPKHGQALQQ